MHCVAFSERLLQPRLEEIKRAGGREDRKEGREGGRRAERRAQMLDMLVAQEANGRIFRFVMFGDRSTVGCWS